MTHFTFGCLLVFGLAAAPASAASNIDAATAAYYRQGLPKARTFVPKTIDANRLNPADRDNTAYLQALGETGETVGYIREFTGPVSTAGLCPCNPLAVTLVFAPDLTLADVLTRAPLQKYGHAPLSADEQQHMVAIAKNPSQKLLQAQRGEDLIDATTGATRQAYAPMVVSQAALSTQRLVSIVQDTREILRGAPASEDRQAVSAILAAQMTPQERAQALAQALPKMQNADLQLQVYHYMANTYLQALVQGGKPDAAVEARMLAPGLLHPRGDDDVAQACYAVCQTGLRPAWVRQCLARLEKTRANPTYLTLLRGTERFMAGDMNAALLPLQTSAGMFPIAQLPDVHWRLAKAAMATKKADVACRVAKDLFAVHPMLPKLSEVTAACPNEAETIEVLRQNAKQALLRTRHASGPKVGTTQVRDQADKLQTWPLYDPKKVTVAIFFATWCPHCRTELPRINAYVEALAKKDKDVQVFAIRTATDKETEPYATFLKEAAPKFPIFTDQANSSNFAAFAKAQNLPLALPVVAIIDRQGVVRYILEPGDYRDTQSELKWAVDSLR